jgi:HTH-like domain
VRRRQAVSYVREHHGHSERRICRALHITRSSVRYVPQPRGDEAALTQSVIRLASQYGRYGYRRIHALVMAEGWQVSRSRVERIWKREGLKVPKKQPRRGRLWLADGSCLRLRPQYPNHVWSWDFVMERTHDGRVLKILVLIDEFTRRCLALHVARQIRSNDVIDLLADVMQEHGVPDHLRSGRRHTEPSDHPALHKVVVDPASAVLPTNESYTPTAMRPVLRPASCWRVRNQTPSTKGHQGWKAWWGRT